MPRLTPESLSELWEVIDRKLEELAARDAEDPRAERVVFVAAGLPLAPRGPDTEPGREEPGTAGSGTEGGSGA
jgi:hypothetical protein